MNNFWQWVKPALIIPRYDMLRSISYDIHLGQDQNVGQDLGHDLHPPNISWIHDVNLFTFNSLLGNTFKNKINQHIQLFFATQISENCLH